MVKRFGILMFVLLFSVVFITACGNNDGDKQNNKAEPDTSEQNNENNSDGEEDVAADYGDTGGITLPIVDEPVELTWMLVSETQDLNDSFIVKEIEERTGIKLNIQAYPGGTYGEKLSTVVASGQLPDIFHGLTISEINDLGQKGAVVAISDYLDELPNFKKLYAEENDWVMKSYSDDNENMYTWPIYGLNRDVNHGFMYRKDIFDENGIELWNNTDEFYEALKTLKEIYPDSTPYVSKNTEYIFRDWAYGWDVGGTDYPMFYDENAQTWAFQFTDERHKEMLDFMKKLYNEGLLDTEFITDTEASWTTKMTTEGAGFVTFDWIGRLDMFYEQVKDQNPDYDLRYGNPVGPTDQIRSLPKISTFGHAVTKNDKSEVALKLLDYLSSPAGGELITMGVEGKNYEFDSDGNVTYPDLATDVVDITILEEEYGMWLEGMYLRPDERSVYFHFSEKEQEAQDMMVDKRAPLDPVLKFTNEENTLQADLQPNLLQAGIEFSTKYVMTESHGDAEWDAWLKEAERLKVDEYIEVFNNAQERYDDL